MTVVNDEGARTPLAAMAARLSRGKANFAAGLIGILIGGSAVAVWAGQGDSSSPADRAQVETIVHDYILANPQILPEAMERLREREYAQVIDTHRAAFETPFAGAWAGAEKGDVVLVEFFDYACGFCRQSNADVDRLLREDSKLKVVWREWPVLGPDSEAAARVSMAAAIQGRFKPFHDRMFELGRPSAETIGEAQRTVGMKPEQIASSGGSAPVRAELGRNHEMARALNASGTPTFVVGDRVLQGAVGYEALKAAIAEVRQRA